MHLRNSLSSSLEWAPIQEQLPRRNVKRFRGGLVFKAHRLCVSLNFRPESTKKEQKKNDACLENSSEPHKWIYAEPFFFICTNKFVVRHFSKVHEWIVSPHPP